MGRRKITINKIRDSRNQRLTYYKRRNGLLKKAIELSILCDVEVLLIIADKKSKKHTVFNSGFLAGDLIQKLGKQYGTCETYTKDDVLFPACSSSPIVLKIIREERFSREKTRHRAGR